MAMLRRNYLAEDLRRETAAVGVEGVVSVQARQTLEETAWLLEIAEQNDFIRGVVGWVSLVSENVEQELARFAGRAKLKAVRHVLQNEPDDDYMLREDFNRGIGRLKKFGLVYDILIFERHLPQAIKLVDRNPEQIFMLDHVAKPRIRDAVISPWRENMRELARRDNVYCKLSGMATEADHHAWTPEQLRPYMEAAMEEFGPRRMMFGSDWPVCLLACEYRRWFELVTDFVSRLSAAEQSRVMGETAIEAYGL